MIFFKHSKYKQQAGVTLIELVMVITIVGVMIGIMAPMLNVANDLIYYFIDRENLKDDGDAAYARITREFRRVQDNLSIVTANAGEFRFLDVDGNDLQYVLSGTTLYRRQGSGGTQRTMMENVSSLTFTYMDDDGVVIPTPNVGIGNMTELRKIRIDVTLQKNNETVHLTTDISPKNFRHETDLFP